MPNTTPVSLLPGTLPYDCYPDNPQQLNVDIVTRIQGFLAETFPGIYVGNATPPVSARNRVWFNTDSTQAYFWINGAWLRKFYPTADSKKLYPFWGSESDVDSEDGGTPGTVGDATGPLWVIDHTMDGRTWVGAGDVPNTSPTVTLAIGDLVGSWQIALDDLKYIPYHGHNMAPLGTQVDPTAQYINVGTFQAGGDWRSNDSPTLRAAQFKYEGGDPADAAHKTVAHDNFQPSKAGLWIRRTARIYVGPPY